MFSRKFLLFYIFLFLFFLILIIIYFYFCVLCVKIFLVQNIKDVIEEYCKDAVAIIKPHPRDELDYKTVFKNNIVIEGKFPMEVLNFIPNMNFDKVISVFTVPGSIKFSGEVVFLGQDFMDKYEDPKIHRANEFI